VATGAYAHGFKSAFPDTEKITMVRILNYYLQVTNAGEENVVNMGNTKELHAHLIIWKKLTTF
jgi:hypothetical protein